MLKYNSDMILPDFMNNKLFTYYFYLAQAKCVHCAGHLIGIFYDRNSRGFYQVR